MVDQTRVVVVTGGTAGVGRATARHFAQKGYQVAVLARSEEGLQETVAELEAFGHKALGLPVDVADAEQVEQAAEQIEQTLGPIEVWVNVAMNTVVAPVVETTAEEYKRVTEVTYLGAVNGTLAALKRMRARNRGTIVQTGSALAYRSIPLQSAYCAAKAAIRGFTDSLRSELIHDKSRIRLSMVQLPGINTPQFEWSRNKLNHRVQPVPPIYQPEVAARAIFDAAQRAPREIWLGKATLQSIVGNMFFPGLLDKLLAKQAYSGQMTEEPEDQARPDYLYEPVVNLHRTHGRFNENAKQRAISVDSNLFGVAAVTLLGVGIAALTCGRKRRR